MRALIVSTGHNQKPVKIKCLIYIRPVSENFRKFLNRIQLRLYLYFLISDIL